jgi:hypothetical protein
MFELRELAEWAGAWTPRPLEISDVTCGTCGKAGVRTVAEGETVDAGPVYCRTCEPAAEEEASIPAPGPAPAVASSSAEESVEDATWPRRSLA